MLQKLWKFISYWYFRYLVVTELYMVEPWERILMHILFAIPFVGVWCFAYSFVSEMTRLSEFVKISDEKDINPLPVSF